MSAANSGGTRQSAGATVASVVAKWMCRVGERIVVQVGPAGAVKRRPSRPGVTAEIFSLKAATGAPGRARQGRSAAAFTQPRCGSASASRAIVPRRQYRPSMAGWAADGRWQMAAGCPIPGADAVRCADGVVPREQLSRRRTRRYSRRRPRSRFFGVSRLSARPPPLSCFEYEAVSVSSVFHCISCSSCAEQREASGSRGGNEPLVEARTLRNACSDAVPPHLAADAVGDALDYSGFGHRAVGRPSQPVQVGLYPSSAGSTRRPPSKAPAAAKSRQRRRAGRARDEDLGRLQVQQPPGGPARGVGAPLSWGRRRCGHGGAPFSARSPPAGYTFGEPRRQDRWLRNRKGQGNALIALAFLVSPP